MKRLIGLAVLSCVTLTHASCGGASSSPTPAQTPAPTPSPAPVAPTPVVPPKATEGAAITVTARGLVVEVSSPFGIGDLHIYQGSRLTLTNADTEPHDVLSDPPHIHTDCPELNTMGYVVPGQTHVTDPLTRLGTCGFHDHTHEGDAAFAGKVTIEAR